MKNKAKKQAKAASQQFKKSSKHSTPPRRSDASKNDDNDSSLKPKGKPLQKLSRRDAEFQHGYRQFNETLIHQTGLKLRKIEADGNCCFRALADQLYGDESRHMELRECAVEEIKSHPQHYMPFIGDEAMFDKYVAAMSKAACWGGQSEVIAVARRLNLHIFVHQHRAPRFEIWPPVYSDEENDDETDTIQTIRRQHNASKMKNIHVAFHDMGHYSSVRNADDDPQAPPTPIDSLRFMSPNQSANLIVAKDGAATEAEKIVTQNTQCNDLSRVRALLQENSHDCDLVCELILAEQQQADEAIDQREASPASDSDCELEKRTNSSQQHTASHASAAAASPISQVGGSEAAAHILSSPDVASHSASASSPRDVSMNSHAASSLSASDAEMTSSPLKCIDPDQPQQQPQQQQQQQPDASIRSQPAPALAPSPISSNASLQSSCDSASFDASGAPASSIRAAVRAKKASKYQLKQQKKLAKKQQSKSTDDASRAKEDSEISRDFGSVRI